METRRAAELGRKLGSWQEHMSRWEVSGLSQIEYCRRNRVNIKSFTYWKKKIFAKSSLATLVEVPAQILSHSAEPERPPLCLVVHGQYRIEIGSGFDADTLDRLIGVLGRP